MLFTEEDKTFIKISTVRRYAVRLSVCHTRAL